MKRVEIKLDKTTLPSDGDKVRFCTKIGEYFTGQYIADEGMFWVANHIWFFAWDVSTWEKIS